MTDYNINFLEEAENIKEQLIAWRRDFHQNPELGFEEYRTSKVIKEFLDSEGISYLSVANTGICAIIKGAASNGVKKKTIGIRADIDALPLKDNKGCSYASKVEGKMHACGHDAHMTVLLGVAKILNKHKDKLKGNVKLIFEPAEETVGGARFMIKEGILENPRVDGVIGLHVSEAIEAGKVGIKQGVFNAASNPFTIKIKGKGGHGAHPEDTIDPVFISSQVIMALQSIVSREIPPQSPAVVTIGSIHGGTAQNIIPEEVELKGIIRTMKTEHRELAKKRLVEITEGICKTMKASCEINIEESYPCLYNDDNMIKLLKEGAEKIVGSENILELEYPSMGVESFAYFSMERPSAFYFLGSANFIKGIDKPAHGSLFDIEEDCLPLGVAIQCQTAFDFLNYR
ncbi:M20 metallopeptidase family protein [Desnuesiella massiliensis]|uniref:M20 metallopeptidase family protein n=1 Tax=Desnuesiella massiliensis TaxID=1650662 RepID=UPI000AB94B64|nr:amidohydrolase [Desnuesiella massiliensis]